MRDGSYIPPTWEYRPGFLSSDVVYRHSLKISLEKSSPDQDEEEPVYECAAVLNSRSPLSAIAVPWLIRASLQNFPGQNGETITVIVEPPAENKPEPGAQDKKTREKAS